MLPSHSAVARRPLTGAFSKLHRPLQVQPLPHAVRWLSLPTHQHPSEEDLTKARKWYEGFSHAPYQVIPQTLGEVSYSRSSGPGGQNVNKVNSKAQLRVPVVQLLDYLPTVLHPAIRASRYYADKSDSLLIQADESRKAGTNKDTCYHKLKELVADAYRSAVPGETSAEQKEKVQKLKKSENESRLRLKKKLSNKKAGRSKRSDD